MQEQLFLTSDGGKEGARERQCERASGTVSPPYSARRLRAGHAAMRTRKRATDRHRRGRVAARGGADDMRFRHSELRERANAYFEEIRDEARGSVR